MRQIFTALPYVEPAVPDDIAALIRANGRALELKAGDILKMPGDLHHFYMVEEGVCGYFVAGAVFGHSRILSLLPPQRTVADLSVSTQRRCNIETRAVTARVRAWACPARFFHDFIYSDPKRAEELYLLAVNKHESTVEGMVANFTLPPEQRLKILLKRLIVDSLELPEAETWLPVRWRLTAEIMGLVVNLTRSNVSRQLNLWREAGLTRKVGLDWEAHRALFDDIYDWQTEFPAADGREVAKVIASLRAETGE